MSCANSSKSQLQYVGKLTELITSLRLGKFLKLFSILNICLTVKPIKSGSSIQLSLFFLFAMSFSNAQDLIEPTKQVTFGSKIHTNRDVLNNSLKDSNNDIYLIGTTEDDLTFNDIQIIKLNSGLSEIWRKVISFETDFSYDRVIDSYLDSEDNLILFCKSAFNKLEETLVVLKINSLGEELWRLPFSDLSSPTGVHPSNILSSLDQNNVLHISYAPWIPNVNPSEQRFVEISSNGEIISDYIRSDIYGENIYPYGAIEFKDGFYHAIIVENTNTSPYWKYTYKKFNEDSRISNEIVLTQEQIDFVERSEYQYLKINDLGNVVWVVPHSFSLNSVSVRGYSLFFLNGNGELIQSIPVDNNQDKYVIGLNYDNDNNFIVTSNNKIKNSIDQLAFTFQKYDGNGNLISISSNANELGRVPFFKNSFFGLYTESNKLLKYDYDFNLQLEVQLNPINGLFFDPNSMLFINGDTYLGGTDQSPIYDGSDFLSQRDWIFKKANGSLETGQFIFSGEGTSKSFSNKSIQKDENGNYIVAITEKAGPDNLNIGGSRSPYISHIITYDSDLTYLYKSTATGSDTYNNIWAERPDNIVPFELNGDNYEYSYDYNSNTFELTKNNSLKWSRTWSVGSQDTPSGFIVDSKGSLVFRTNLYGVHRPAINRITIDNQLFRLELDKNPERMIMLDNDWIFTTNDISIVVFSNDFDVINETGIENDFNNPNYAPMLQKNNKVLIHTSYDKNLKIYNHYGELENTYILNGDLRERYGFIEGNDLILMGSIGKYIIREYSWLRSTISRYENFVIEYIGETSFEDADGDGVSDFIDRCPDTPVGNMVNEFGCNSIVLDDTNFIVKAVTESCPSSNNGSIQISASENHNYSAVLLDGINEISTKQFTSQVNFANINAGAYTVCVKVEGVSEFERCFELVVEDLEELFVNSKIDVAQNKLTLNLSGGRVYHIKLNDKSITTSESTVSLDLDKNQNSLTVSTDKQCQGVHKENVISISEPLVYPNPLTDGNLYISLTNSQMEKVEVSVYGTNGQLFYSDYLRPIGGMINLNMENYNQGVYVLKLQLENSSRTYKILKR